MSQIETYVFLDLVTLTTDFLKTERNKTKRIELCMMAVKRIHFIGLQPGELPRVIHKLLVCFNPTSVNDPDRNIKLYVFNTIINFLEHLQKPVCLIAQNGDIVDFPFLKNHFEKLKCRLPDGILCVDSHQAFNAILNIDKSVDNKDAAGPSSYGVESSSRKRVLDTKNESSNEESELNCKRSRIIDNAENDLHAQSLMQEQNEQTPKKVTQQKDHNKNYATDEKLEKTANEKKELLSIYYNVFKIKSTGTLPEPHRAENYCVMTLKISKKIGNRFVGWLHFNHTPFADIKAMKSGVPLSLGL